MVYDEKNAIRFTRAYTGVQRCISYIILVYLNILLLEHIVEIRFSNLVILKENNTMKFKSSVQFNDGELILEQKLKI